MKATPLLLPVDIFSIYTLQLVHNDPFFTPIRRPLPQTRFLKLGWRPEAISKEIFNPVRTIRWRVICFDTARRFPLEIGLLGDLVS